MRRHRLFTSSRIFHTGPLTSNCCRWSTVRGLRDSSHIGIGRIEGDPVIVGFLKDQNPVEEQRSRQSSQQSVEDAEEPLAARYTMIVNRNPARRGRVVIELQNGWSAVEINKHDGKTEQPLQATFHVGLAQVSQLGL